MMEEIGKIEKFEEYLKDQNLAVNTITSYLYAIRQFNRLYDTLTRICEFARSTAIWRAFRKKSGN